MATQGESLAAIYFATFAATKGCGWFGVSEFRIIVFAPAKGSFDSFALSMLKSGAPRCFGGMPRGSGQLPPGSVHLSISTVCTSCAIMTLLIVVIILVALGIMTCLNHVLLTEISLTP